MSRFGVFSLLLVLGLDLGTSLTPGCNDMFCKVRRPEVESGFREASSSSDYLLRAHIGAFVPGSSSEDTTLRKFHSDDEEELRNLHLTEVEEGEHGFRHVHHPHTPKKRNIAPVEPDSSYRYVVNTHYLSYDDTASKKNHNAVCKYTKAILRNIIEIIRPFFG